MLHIEFEREVKSSMVYRMGVYHALILEEFRLPVKQVVVNLDERIARVPTDFKHEESFKGYELVNLHQFDPNEMISSQVPEMIILAVLGHFEVERVEAFLRLIIRKLKEVCQSEGELLKYLNQLTLLSRIRKFEKITKKTISDMPITYDVKKDAFYIEGQADGLAKGLKQGLSQGISQGISQGLSQGRTEEKVVVVERCFRNGLDEEMAVKLSGLPLEKVQAIYEYLRQKDQD